MKNILKPFLFIALASLTFAADFVVIVNPTNSASSISSTELKRIYTGKMSQFGGQQVVAINLADTDPLFTAFVDKITKMSPAEYKQFWVDAQIKGEGTAPMIQRNSAAAKMIVSSIPGAIAYIDASVVDGTVKKIDLK